MTSLEAGDGGKTKNIRFNVTQHTAGDRKKDEGMKPFLKDVENLIGYCEEYGKNVHGMATVIKSSLPLFKKSKKIKPEVYDRLKDIMEDNPNVEPTLGNDGRIGEIIKKAEKDFYYDLVLEKAATHFLEYYGDELKEYFGLIEEKNADDESKVEVIMDAEKVKVDNGRCEECGEDDFANKADFDMHKYIYECKKVTMNAKKVTVNNGRKTGADLENSDLRDDVTAQKDDNEGIVRCSLERFTQACSKLLTEEEYPVVLKKLSRYFDELNKEQTKSVRLATFIKSKCSTIINDFSNRFVVIRDVLEEMKKHRELGSSRATKSDNGKASSSGRKVIPAPTDDKEDTLEKTGNKDYIDKPESISTGKASDVVTFPMVAIPTDVFDTLILKTESQPEEGEAVMPAEFSNKKRKIDEEDATGKSEIQENMAKCTEQAEMTVPMDADKMKKKDCMTKPAESKGRRKADKKNVTDVATDEEKELEGINRCLKCNNINLEAKLATPKDGNCWFHSVVDQISQFKPTDHIALRREVCNFVKSLPEDIRKRMIEHIFHKKPAFLKKNVRKMRRKGEWADYMIMITTAYYLERNINLYGYPTEPSTRPCSITRIEGGEKANEHPPLNIFYYNDNHFQSLQPVKEDLADEENDKDIIEKEHKNKVNVSRQANEKQIFECRMMEVTDDKNTLEKTEEEYTDEVQSKDSLARPNKRRRERDDKACNGSLMVMKKKQRKEKNTRVEQVEVLNEKADKSDSNGTEILDNDGNTRESEKSEDESEDEDARSMDIMYEGEGEEEDEEEKEASSNEEKLKNEDPIYSCDICSYKDKYKSSVKRHKRAIHNDKHNCKECDFSTTIAERLKHHVLSHVDPQIQSFKCTKCDKLFRQPSSRSRHVTKVHRNGRHTCKICNRVFTLKETLRVHLGNIHKVGSYIKKEYPCEYCSHITYRRDALRKHISVKHKKIKDKLIMEDRKKMNANPVGILKEKVGRNNSNNKESEEADDKDGKKDTTSKNVKHAGKILSNENHTYACDICSFKGKNKNSLTTHRRHIHKIMHKCTKCEYKTTILRYLKLHQRTHVDRQIQQFRCGKCPKKFRHDTNLSRHKTSQHGSGGNHICKICKQVFTMKGNLRVHLGAIHNEGSYIKQAHHCSFCSHVTDRSYNLRKHIELNHKE